jgi:peptidoglycan/xylan/chitin deacetylase (PgdA/CDA1 family)
MAARELMLAARGPFIRGVPVLMYHGLLRSGEIARGDRAGKYWIPGESFRAQLSQIAREGLRVARLGDLWSREPRNADVRTSAAITFDDGRASDYEVAFPALQASGAGADFFVNTGEVGRAGYLTWTQITEMRRGGCSFSSHSHDHVALVGLSPGALRSQLERSKHMLEDRLGEAVEFLAVPYGFVNRRVIAMAREVGYRAVCTSRYWPSQPGRSRINRIAVNRDTTLDQLAALLRGRWLPFMTPATRAGLGYLPKRILLRWQPQRLGVRVLGAGK